MLTPEIIVILFTRGLPCVQCTKNRLTRENYTANYYKIFQEHQLYSRRFPVSPAAISNSSRFPGFRGVPGVADTLKQLDTTQTVHTAEKELTARLQHVN